MHKSRPLPPLKGILPTLNKMTIKSFHCDAVNSLVVWMSHGLRITIRSPSASLASAQQCVLAQRVRSDIRISAMVSTVVGFLKAVLKQRNMMHRLIIRQIFCILFLYFHHQWYFYPVRGWWRNTSVLFLFLVWLWDCFFRLTGRLVNIMKPGAYSYYVSMSCLLLKYYVAPCM